MSRPRGFTVFAVILAFMIWDPVLRVILPAEGGRPGVRVVPELVIVALMAISIEALWRVRPWAARALGALCGAVVLKAFVAIDFGQPSAMVWTAVAAVVLLAAVLAVPVTYVHDRLRAIHGRAPVRGQHPRPAPPGAAPGRVP